MKFLPLIALTVAISAHAADPSSAVQNVGQSQKPAQEVSACIAKSWADKSQQQVVSQNVLANGLATDVYAPGQQPPNGAAAMVRPADTAGAKTWVGFRAGSGAGADAAGAISACL